MTIQNVTIIANSPMKPIILCKPSTWVFLFHIKLRKMLIDMVGAVLHEISLGDFLF